MVLRSESVLKFGAIPYGVNGMIGIEPCVDKIQKEIKWKAKKTFRDGIKAIIDFQVK